MTLVALRAAWRSATALATIAPKHGCWCSVKWRMDTLWKERFGGIDRLYGSGALARLRVCHVTVVGIGGVGSWAVEALARSGVGRLTLRVGDEWCVSRTTQQ